MVKKSKLQKILATSFVFVLAMALFAFPASAAENIYEDVHDVGDVSVQEFDADEELESTRAGRVSNYQVKVYAVKPSNGQRYSDELAWYSCAGGTQFATIDVNMTKAQRAYNLGYTRWEVEASCLMQGAYNLSFVAGGSTLLNNYPVNSTGATISYYTNPFSQQQYQFYINNNSTACYANLYA